MSTMTEREQALVGNRVNKTPGSASWSWQTIEALQFMWENLEICYDSYVQLWREVEEQAVWDKVPPDNPYGSKEAMLKALAVGDEDSASAKVAGMAAATRPLNANGGDRKKDHLVLAQGDSVTYGTGSATYLTARIARDHPEIHRRMMNGEFKTVADAARAAGIHRKRTRTVGLLDDTAKVAANIRKHYTPEQVKALKEAL